MKKIIIVLLFMSSITPTFAGKFLTCDVGELGILDYWIYDKELSIGLYDDQSIEMVNLSFELNNKNFSICDYRGNVVVEGTLGTKEYNGRGVVYYNGHQYPARGCWIGDTVTE